MLQSQPTAVGSPKRGVTARSQSAPVFQTLISRKTIDDVKLSPSSQFGKNPASRKPSATWFGSQVSTQCTELPDLPALTAGEKRQGIFGWNRDIFNQREFRKHGGSHGHR